MTPSVDLFNLIHSLDLAEMRHVKTLFASRNGSKDYLKLFSAIEKQKKYDEEAILQEFKNEPFVKRFAVVKNYLYSVIIRHLSSLHINISKEVELKNLLHQVAILFEKSFYGPCEKIIRKAITMGMEYELFTSHLEAVEWERRLNFTTKGRTSNVVVRESTSRKRKDIIEKLLNQNQFEIVSKRLSDILDNPELKNQKQRLAELKKIHGLSIIEKESNAKSVRALRTLYSCKKIYYLICMDLRRAYESSKKLMAHYEKYPWLKTENIFSYIIDVNNHAIRSLHIKEYENALKCVRDLKSTSVYGKAQEAGILEASYRLELYIYIEMGRYDLAIKQIEQNKFLLNKYQNKIGAANLYSIYYSTALVHFLTGSNKKALRELNIILNHPEFKNFNHLFPYFEVFLMVIHYELEHIKIVESLMKSQLNVLDKKQTDFNFKQFIFSFMDKLVKLEENPEKINLFKLKLDELRKLISGDKYLTQNIYLIDFFIIWFVSHSKREPIQQISRTIVNAFLKKD